MTKERTATQSCHIMIYLFLTPLKPPVRRCNQILCLFYSLTFFLALPGHTFLRAPIPRNRKGSSSFTSPHSFSNSPEHATFQDMFCEPLLTWDPCICRTASPGMVGTFVHQLQTSQTSLLTVICPDAIRSDTAQTHPFSPVAPQPS